MSRNDICWWPMAIVLALSCLGGKAEAKGPRILLLGDSITMQYSPYVIGQLKDRVEVYRCRQNSNWTGRLLKELLGDILDAEGCQWDVVWFNVGNWDITPAAARFIRKKPDWGFVEGKPKTSIPDYEKNMAEIIRRIRQHSPDVQLVFTTTTFIPRVGAAGAEAFSHAAVKVMQQNGVPVFDLYAATKPHVGLLLYEDNTHFSKVANETAVIGPYVAGALKSFIDTGSLPVAEAAATLPIPKEAIPALKKDRDVGYPKHRGKSKKK